MRLEAIVVALLLLTTAFAGCLAGDDGSGDPVETQSNTPVDDTVGNVGTAAGAPTDGDAMVAFAFDGKNQHVPVEESGSFSPQQTCYAGGCFTGSSFTEIDLTSKAPVAVPSHIMLTLDYSATGGSANLFLSGDGATFYTYDYEHDYENEQVHVEAMVGLQNGDGLTAVVAGYLPGEGGNVDWTLNGTVMSHATVAPAQVPVAVTVPAGLAGFHLGGAHGADASGEAMVWGPDDTFLGTFTGDQGITVDLGENATRGDPKDGGAPPQGVAGEYVVFLKSFEAEPAADAHEHAKHLADMGLEVHPIGMVEDGSSLPSLRMLDLEVTTGTFHPLNPGDTVEWSFDQATAPLATGFAVRADGPVSVTYVPSRDAFEGTVASPAGTVLELADSGGWWITSDSVSFHYLSEPAHENLVPGTYDASFTLHESMPVEVADLTVTFVR